MKYNSAKYIASYGTEAQLKPSEYPEIAFAGRSNVGKSSLMNKLFDRKNLVRVSSKPGKTTLINFFRVENTDFVDLPGYGYAKVAKSEKERWSALIEGYFNQDRNFALVVSLIDIRHEPSKLDTSMVAYLQELELPFVIALTKADKLSKMQRQKQLAVIKRSLAIADNSKFIVTSAEKGIGIDELRTRINSSI